MLRHLLVITVLFLLTACAELKVVGNAATRELMADGVNVERAYRTARN